MNHKSDVLIIGAGVIGMASAYELSKMGAHVTVIGRREPGYGCSYGNAGWLTPCFAMPLPMPGMLIKSLKWLMDPMSPLRIKPEPTLLLLRWLLRFLGSMTMRRAVDSISALTEISKYSLDRYSQLEKELGFPLGFQRKGLLMVSQTDVGLGSAIQEMELVARHGIPGRFLNESQVKELEPALTGFLKGGVYFPDEAHCEPLSVVKGFAQASTQNGVKVFPSTEVFDFRISQNQVTGVRTTRGWFEAKQIVLATGSWTHALSGRLSMSLPILGGKGYALILKQLNPMPQVPIMIVEKKVAVTPRQDTIRIAGTLELVNQDESINRRRLDAILHGARQCLNVPEDPEVVEVWRGLRPCTPDGVPIIGFSKKYPNLLVAAGHQMLGLQSAPGTARLVADLISGNQPTFDPWPFRAARYE